MQNDTNNSFEVIMSNVKEILPAVQSYTVEIEEGRRLPPSLVKTLKNTGVFRMTMPKNMGGAELDPISQIKIIETLATVNASAAWCSMIGSDSGFFSSFLKPEVAKEMYPDPDTISAAALSQTGKAVKVEGGYLVSGRWPFASGCQHSEWLISGCKVFEGDTMCLLDGDVPQTIQCFLKADQVTILDTWHSMGLKGSGSHDFTADKIFVPEEKTFSFQKPRSYQEGALYQFPLAFMFNFAAVPLGIAQSAINAIVEAADKPIRQMTLQGQFIKGRTLKDEAFVQDTLGRAIAKLAAARAYFYTEVTSIWEAISAQEPLTAQNQVNFLAMNTEVFSLCQEVVELIVKARGGSSVYAGSPLEIAMRDIITINQHVMVSIRNYSQSGKVSLGLAPEQILL
jgi:alkylation response protein AidB-like acyl-CoA dehydrogenase